MSADYTPEDIARFLKAANSDLSLNKYSGDEMIPDYCKAVLIGFQLTAQLATADERIKKMSKGDLGPESILSGFSVLVKSLEKRRDELRDGLSTAKEENKRLRYEAEARWQLQTCPYCNKTFATLT